MEDGGGVVTVPGVSAAGRGTPRLGGAMKMDGSGALLISFAAALGAVVGARAVVAVDLPGTRSLLGLPSVPRESLGVVWSPGAVWPHEIQAGALERMAGTLATLFLAVAAVALLNTLVLLVEAGAARRRDLAIRAAVGAGPRVLLSVLARQMWAVVAAAWALGLLLGMGVGGGVRASWPGVALPVAWADALATVLPALMVMTALAALGYLWAGVRVGHSQALARVLAAGQRGGEERAAVFQRRVLSALQLGGAGSLALVALAISLGGFVPAPGTWRAGADSVALSARAVGAPPDWSVLLDDLRALEGMDAATLASPGALIGLGVRDLATAQCGRCYRGGLPLPIWGARADHHAVAPGFMEDHGPRVLRGRGFNESDGAGSPRVALVNLTFANTAFEGGDPLGRSVRVGRGLDDWYEVVGVVEDRSPLGIGGDDVTRAGVYLSAFQHAPAGVDLFLRGTRDSVAAARALLAGRDVVTSEPRTVDLVRAAALAPLGWAALAALGLSLLALAIAVHGARTTALQVTRRREHELAVRRALGATDARVLAHVLGGSVRTALWGGAVALFFGPLLLALLRKASSGIPGLALWHCGVVGALLVGAAVLAAWQAAREALSVAPYHALE